MKMTSIFPLFLLILDRLIGNFDGSIIFDAFAQGAFNSSVLQSRIFYKIWEIALRRENCNTIIVSYMM